MQAFKLRHPRSKVDMPILRLSLLAFIADFAN
jgi:hypothetical protein